MKKLRLKLWRIKNVVLMKVLEQDESLRGKGFIFETYDFKIWSVTNPCLTFDDTFYIRGTVSECDNNITCREFDCADKAQNYIQTVIDTVRAYNESISTEPITDDIETYIAE